MDYEIMMNGNVRIGDQAPNFEADSTMGKVTLDTYKGKWLVLFSHPGDFTPVCTTEIIGFSKAYTYFKELDTNILGLSVDSNPSHLAWLYDIYLKTGITVPFPIIADRNGTVARKYGMIGNDDNTETVRNVFIIDDKGIVRLILVYPKEIGRSIPEILRSLEALKTSDKYNVVMPVNWIKGDPYIQKVPKTYKELEERNNEISEKMNGMNWYLTFKLEDELNKRKEDIKKQDEKK